MSGVRSCLVYRTPDENVENGRSPSLHRVAILLVNKPHSRNASERLNRLLQNIQGRSAPGRRPAGSCSSSLQAEKAALKEAIQWPCCCCCRPHSTNVLPAESSTRNHVAASSLSPQVARKGSTLSGFVQRSRLEREVGRDLHSNKWEEV